MGKFLFKVFIEIPAAIHVWIQLAAWGLVGGNFVYMAARGMEIYMLIPFSLLGVASAAVIGSQLPPLLQRLAAKALSALQEHQGLASGQEHPCRGVKRVFGKREHHDEDQ